jgi:hypothetical protein
MDLTIYSDDDTQVGTTQIGSASTGGLGYAMLGTFMLGTDGNTSTATDGISTFVDNPISIGLNLDSRTIKYKIYNNRINENFVLLGEVYAYYPKSHYVFESSRKIYL